MKPLSLLTFAVVPLLSACANTGHLTEVLSPSNAADRYEVKVALTYVEMRGVFPVRWEAGLLPCTFRAAKSNTQGTFFEGDGKCVTQKMGSDTMGGPYRGGIWVPMDTGKAARLYYYFDYDVDTAIKGGGILTAAILQASKGDLTLMPDIKDAVFLSALKTAHQPSP